MESMTRRARLRRYLLKAFQLDEGPWVIFLEVGAYRREIVSSTHIGQFTGRPGCPTFWLGRHLEIPPCPMRHVL
jgi:hypothetical protein